MLIGTIRRIGDHDDQLGGLSILGAVLNSTPTDADGDPRFGHRGALGMGNGHPLLKPRAIQLFPCPDIRQKSLLVL